jgi:hypothetical protein
VIEYTEIGTAIDTVPRFGMMGLIGRIFGSSGGIRVPGIAVGPVDEMACAIEVLTVVGKISIAITIALNKIV